MENYYVQGSILEGKKAVLAVGLPEAGRNNIYGIYDIYNISNSQENKIVIHFKDFLGKPLAANGNLESFIIDLNNLVVKNKETVKEIDFKKIINVALIHDNSNELGDLEEIYLRAHRATQNKNIDIKGKDIEIPDTTGRGTIRESV